MDSLMLEVLGGREVIDIDQDLLGKQGTIVKKEDEEFILRSNAGS